MVRRKKQLIIAKHLSKKEFTILVGQRQIGKSTMLKQLYTDLLSKGETCYFLNLDRKDILDDLNLNPSANNTKKEYQIINPKIVLTVSIN